jgi:cobalt/nickel transport system permease protein
VTQGYGQGDNTTAPRGARRRRRSLARQTADAIAGHIGEVLENEDCARRAGLLQRIEPRSKLLSLLAFAITVSLVRSAWVLAGLVVAALLLAWASRVSLRSFVVKVWATAGLLAVLLAAPATTSLVTPGPALARIGPVALTVPGVVGAVTLVLRVVASASVALLIVWTTRWTDLLHALTVLKVPDVVVATMAMTLKHVVALMRTVQQVHLARESRTLSVGNAAENRAWVIGRMAFVVQKSVKTADDVYDAMLARGFDGAVRAVHRTGGGAAGWLWLAVTAAACVGALGIDRAVMAP